MKTVMGNESLVQRLNVESPENLTFHSVIQLITLLEEAEIVS
jgi:hypothetical protein